MVIVQIKILNEINFFLIIIYILLQLKTLKFVWTTDIQKALLF